MAIKVRPKQAVMSLPMIPVISVVFNLLMVFMLAPSAATAEGFLATNLPKDSGPGPVGGKVEGIRVELYEVGPGGVYLEGARNEYCSIRVAGRELGGDFAALRKFLEDKRDHGLAPVTPVIIAPTMGTLHEWVVQAFDAAVAARFTNVMFAVPYE